MQQHPLIKEYLDIAFRRRWWIVVPAVLGVLIGFALFFRWPKQFKAETKVQFRSQTVSRQLLNPIIEINPGEMVTLINSQITSERYVLELEQRLKLIGTPHGPRDVAELTRRLTGNVEVNPNARNHYFDLAVTWEDPRIAAAIANELAEIYIRRNQEIRQDLADKTVQQLRDTRQDLEKQLLDVRAKIERFRGEHKFELSTQQQPNLTAIETNRHEIARLENEIRDTKDKIEKLELRLSMPTAVPGPGQTADQALVELNNLKRQRDEYLQRGMQPQHPTLRRIEADIAAREAQLGVKGEANGDGTLVTSRDLNRAQDEQQKRSWEAYIKECEGKRARLVDEIGMLQQRLERMPDWQIELDRLQTEERVLDQKYSDAQDKENKASQGKLVEEGNQGERFDILNRARPPAEPFFPDLKLFLAMGLAVGGGLGIAMVLLLEVFDQSFKSEEQLAASIDVAILAVIPDLTRVPKDAPRGGRRSRGKAAG